jgi:peptidoglycan/LPS O-acetylase OafA/YrhL
LTPRATPRPLSHRPDIDGLRAIAVLAVVLFHAGVPGLGGGYVGVDVFFVISGFLITRLVLQDIDTERFSLLQFYERRVRRIFPALFAVLIVASRRRSYPSPA